MIHCKALTYSYQHEKFRFELQAEQGDIIALIGGSGAGKSTLLHLLAGFIEPSSGEVTVAQQSVLGLPPHQRPMAMLFQEHNLFAHLSIEQNIALGIKPNLKLSASDWNQVNTAAKQVEIGDKLERLPEQLSGGQKQRVALARCFVQQKPIWLLDEPFSALDPILRAEMLNLVKQLANELNITIIMVTHHINDAKCIANKFAYVDKGQIVALEQIENLHASHLNESLAKFVSASE